MDKDYINSTRAQFQRAYDFAPRGLARDKIAVKLFGEFASLNFPESYK